MLDDEITSSRRPIFLRALRAAFGRAPQWLFCWFVPLLLGLTLVEPWMSWFGETAKSYAPGEVLASLDENFRQDHSGALASLRADGGGAAAILALVMMAFGVFTAGGWLQIFLERTSGRSVRHFLWGGAKYFWRFARVWLISSVTLAVFAWVTHGWPWETLVGVVFGTNSAEGLEGVTSEWTAVYITWVQAGLFAVLLALLFAWGDYTRTRMALHDGRSAIWAGLCTLFLLIVHPVRTLRPFAILLLVEILVVTLVGSLSWSINAELGPDSTWGSVVTLFALGQVALVWQTITRAARYSAAVQVSQTLVAPLSQPDPWASRIGGPGGPQYPIDETDDYGVSI
jgi:hypothetical protein